MISSYNSQIHNMQINTMPPMHPTQNGGAHSLIWIFSQHLIFINWNLPQVFILLPKMINCMIGIWTIYVDKFCWKIFYHKALVMIFNCCLRKWNSFIYSSYSVVGGFHGFFSNLTEKVVIQLLPLAADAYHWRCMFSRAHGNWSVA